MIFSAIVMVAFSVNASAQTITDALECSSKADQYVRNQGPITDEYARELRRAYYNGCIEGKKKTNPSSDSRQKDTISFSPKQ